MEGNEVCRKHPFEEQYAQRDAPGTSAWGLLNFIHSINDVWRVEPIWCYYAQWHAVPSLRSFLEYRERGVMLV